jgi:hypothetical protein
MMSAELIDQAASFIMLSSHVVTCISRSERAQLLILRLSWLTEVDLGHCFMMLVCSMGGRQPENSLSISFMSK